MNAKRTWHWWRVLLVIALLASTQRHARADDADDQRITDLRARAGTGEAGAQNDLGECYAKGEGTTKNLEEAINWYRKAADQNLARAQYNLGACYARGEGVAKNLEEAVDWLRKAADQNYARAQYGLGVCYAEGHGVPEDAAEAVKWITLAAAQGDERAKAAIPALEKHMSEQQIAEGKRRANDWLDQRKNASPVTGSQP